MDIEIWERRQQVREDKEFEIWSFYFDSLHAFAQETGADIDQPAPERSLVDPEKGVNRSIASVLALRFQIMLTNEMDSMELESVSNDYWNDKAPVLAEQLWIWAMAEERMRFSGDDGEWDLFIGAAEAAYEAFLNRQSELNLEAQAGNPVQ